MVEIKRLKMGSEPQESCRLCAGTFMSVVPIFGNDDLPMKIQNISSLEVKANDGLPAQICHQCAQLVNLFYHFKLRCESSDCFFRLNSGCIKSDAAENQLEEDADDNIQKDSLCIEKEPEGSAENNGEEIFSSEQSSTDDPVSEANGEVSPSKKPPIPDYVLEPYVRGKPGKKPNFPVELVAQLLHVYREVVLTNDGQIQPKAAPCWQFLCELLNNMLEGTYSTTPNNIYTYVKCNRYNLQSYLGLGTDGKHKQRDETSITIQDDSDDVKANDHDYHVPEDIEPKTVKFLINVSAEEWLTISLELIHGEPFLNRHGWSHINRLFKTATQAKCRMLYSSVVEDDKYLSLQGKCRFCNSVLTGYISVEDLLPGQSVQIYCTFIGRFEQPHPGSNKQRKLFKSGEELTLEVE